MQMQSVSQQEQRRVAVGPGNAHVIIRQVSSDAATLRRCTCGSPRSFSAATAAATGRVTAAAAIRQFTD